MCVCANSSEWFTRWQRCVEKGVVSFRREASWWAHHIRARNTYVSCGNVCTRVTLLPVEGRINVIELHTDAIKVDDCGHSIDWLSVVQANYYHFRFLPISSPSRGMTLTQKSCSCSTASALKTRAFIYIKKCESEKGPSFKSPTKRVFKRIHPLNAGIEAAT